MSTLKRQNNWYVDFRFNRKRYRKKSPVNTKAGAKMYEATLRHKLARGEPLEDVEQKITEVPTLSKFYPTWMTSYSHTNNKPSTIESKRSIFEHNLLPYFGDMKLDGIMTKDIEQYKAHKLGQGKKSKTVNNHISCLGTCLKTAVDWNVIEHVPNIKLLKVPPPQTLYLTEPECRLLLDTADGVYHEMICVVLHTGLRIGELIALKWSDIDFRTQTIKIQRSITVGKEGSTKNNRIRVIPLSDTLIKLLMAMERSNTYVFTKPDGKTPMSQSQCRKKLGKFMKIAGIDKRLSWHGLRHTFASSLANENVNVQFIKELLGHSDIKTTMRYTHIAQESLVSAIGILDRNARFWTQNGHNDYTASEKIIHSVAQIV